MEGIGAGGAESLEARDRLAEKPRGVGERDGGFAGAAVRGVRAEPRSVDTLGLDAGVGKGGVGGFEDHVLIAKFEKVAELGTAHSDNRDFVFHARPPTMECRPFYLDG